MQNFVVYSVVLSAPSPGSITKRKTLKKQNFQNCKWFEVAIATRNPKFLHEGDTPQSFTQCHSMQNFVLYSVVLSARSLARKTEKKYEKRKVLRNFCLKESEVGTRIPKFLPERITPQSFAESHSMQNFALYSVVVSERSPGAINRKKIRKKRNFENWKWFHVALATRIPIFLDEGDIPQSFSERQSMQNFVLYSALLWERSFSAKNW